MTSFVTHLESAIDGTRLPHDRVQTVHNDRPLWVRYDLDAVGRAITPDLLASRPPTLWRYRELLPLPEGAEPVTLGEGMTPLLPAPRLGASLGLGDLWIKDESQLPTGSFKSRGMTVAVSMARHFGLRRLAIPTAGNAGGALAAYAARAGLEAFVFMPRDTPIVNQLECVLAGAKTFLVEGLITDCGAVVRGGVKATGWFDCSTLKEPYRIEGKKTMGLELAEQFDWTLPDVILYPTGGGTGLIGMWKAFHELQQLGWLRRDTLPRMIAVQSDGCAPIARAFQAGERFAEPWENAATCASGLRVPAAVGDFMILDALRESGGCAIAVPESGIIEAMQTGIRAEGIAFCPEAAACILAARTLREEGKILPMIAWSSSTPARPQNTSRPYHTSSRCFETLTRWTTPNSSHKKLRRRLRCERDRVTRIRGPGICTALVRPFAQPTAPRLPTKAKDENAKVTLANRR